MDGHRRILGVVLALAALFLFSAQASAADTLVRGDEACMACHKSVRADAIAGIAQTRHGNKADARTPSCTSCHGPSDKHMAASGGQSPDRVFKGPKKSAPEAINGACLTCHASGARNHWEGSKHQSENLACSNCHAVHTPHDAVLT
jgi:Cytochrome c-type protein NrfB-like